uniref:C2H2-type domain-containing protein n=1 Tax=Bionectria ochroleuca TaxID=29856 RepID=A0A0B7K3W5_BIOOC
MPAFFFNNLIFFCVLKPFVIRSIAYCSTSCGSRLLFNKHKMENHMFDSFLEHCQEFPQASTGLEIFNYTDPAYNSCERYDLFSRNLSEFLHRRGAFKPPVPLGNNVKCIGGLRLM